MLFILNFITLRKYFYSDFKVNIFSKENLEELEVLWKFSLPAILAGLMVGPVTWVCNYLLVNQVNGYNQMANFDIANQWRNTILFIPSALAQIVLPMLSSSIENKSDYYEIFYKNLKLNFYLGLLLVIFFSLISPIIVKFYGSEYSDALYPLILMFVTAFFITINNVIGQAIASQGKMWFGFQLNLVWAFFIIVLSYIFIVYQGLGAIGLSLAYLLSYLIHTIIQYFFAKN